MAESTYIKLVVDSSHCAEEFVGLEAPFHHSVDIVDVETSCLELLAGRRLCILLAFFRAKNFRGLRYLILNAVQEGIVNVDCISKASAHDSQSFLAVPVVDCDSFR